MKTNTSKNQEEKLDPLNILGRCVGWYSGWDDVDHLNDQFYDFVPVEGVNIPKTPTLIIDHENGIIECYDDKNKVIFRKDLVEVLKTLPRVEKIEEE
jgi:hypothetical protein